MAKRRKKNKSTEDETSSSTGYNLCGHTYNLRSHKKVTEELFSHIAASLSTSSQETGNHKSSKNKENIPSDDKTKNDRRTINSKGNSTPHETRNRKNGVISESAGEDSIDRSQDDSESKLHDTQANITHDATSKDAVQVSKCKTDYLNNKTCNLSIKEVLKDADGGRLHGSSYDSHEIVNTNASISQITDTRKASGDNHVLPLNHPVTAVIHNENKTQNQEIRSSADAISVSKSYPLENNATTNIPSSKSDELIIKTQNSLNLLDDPKGTSSEELSNDIYKKSNDICIDQGNDTTEFSSSGINKPITQPVTVGFDSNKNDTEFQKQISILAAKISTCFRNLNLNLDNLTHRGTDVGHDSYIQEQRLRYDRVSEKSKNTNISNNIINSNLDNPAHRGTDVGQDSYIQEQCLWYDRVSDKSKNTNISNTHDKANSKSCNLAMTNHASLKSPQMNSHRTNSNHANSRSNFNYTKSHHTNSYRANSHHANSHHANSHHANSNYANYHNKYNWYKYSHPANSHANSHHANSHHANSHHAYTQYASTYHANSLQTNSYTTLSNQNRFQWNALFSRDGQVPSNNKALVPNANALFRSDIGAKQNDQVLVSRPLYRPIEPFIRPNTSSTDNVKHANPPTTFQSFNSTLPTLKEKPKVTGSPNEIEYLCTVSKTGNLVHDVDSERFEKPPEVARVSVSQSEPDEIEYIYTVNKNEKLVDVVNLEQLEKQPEVAQVNLSQPGQQSDGPPMSSFNSTYLPNTTKSAALFDQVNGSSRVSTAKRTGSDKRKREGTAVVCSACKTDYDGIESKMEHMFIGNCQHLLYCRSCLRANRLHKCTVCQQSIHYFMKVVV